MTSPNDAFIDAIERRKKPLDEALEAYRVFRQRLDALPPELADEALEMLVQAQAQKPDNKTALPTKTESGNGDLSGRTALECAEIILTENHNQPMHFAVVARKAMARGYKGRTSGSAE
jgi:hypothetical protein